MKKISVFAVTATVWLAAAGLGECAEQFQGVYGSGPNHFSLATGSPGELGLLQALGEAFAPTAQATLNWKKAGTGESVKLLKDKAVDMVMVHAPEAEKRAVAEGWAAQRTLIGSNEFFIVGPQDDPAGLGQARDAADAYVRIARAQAKFFSRGDNSGTHQKEMVLWKKAGLEPAGGWYLVTKAFMMATLQRADAEKGYFMTDSSTWVQEGAKLPNLKILFRGDRFLVNTYHALRQPDRATPGATTAAKFIEFVASEAGQKIIREYGGGLYNDAAYALQYDQ